MKNGAKVEVEWGRYNVEHLSGEWLIVWPENESCWTGKVAIFTHGYTSHKGSLLLWGKRLTEEGCAVILFDLPGHYLGGHHPIEEFSHFSEKAHTLFIEHFLIWRQRAIERWNLSESDLDPYRLSLILGGHSLGALLAVKAMALSEFKAFEKKAFCVGLGIESDALSSPFYAGTLNFRAELISPCLRPATMLPWVKKEKSALHLLGALSGEKIFLITGEDDFIAPPEAAKKLEAKLTTLGCKVTLAIFPHLPHDTPERATPHLAQLIKK